MIILLNWEIAAICLKFLVTQPKSVQGQGVPLHYESDQDALHRLYAS